VVMVTMSVAAIPAVFRTRRSASRTKWRKVPPWVELPLYRVRLLPPLRLWIAFRVTGVTAALAGRGEEGLDPLDAVAEVVEFAPQIVPGDHVAHGQSHGRQLPGQELGVGLGLGGAQAVFGEGVLVPVLLAVLREQDQRRGVGGLGGEREVEQDEGVGVEAKRDDGDVEDDPDDHHDRLDQQVGAGAEEPGDGLAVAADGVGVEAEPRSTRRQRRRQRDAGAGCGAVFGHELRPPARRAGPCRASPPAGGDRGGRRPRPRPAGAPRRRRRGRTPGYRWPGTGSPSPPSRWGAVRTGPSPWPPRPSSTAARGAVTGCVRSPGTARSGSPSGNGPRTRGSPARR